MKDKGQARSRRTWTPVGQIGAGGYGSQGYGSQGQGYEGHRDADFGSQYSGTGGEQRGRFQNDPDYHQWRQDQLQIGRAHV